MRTRSQGKDKKEKKSLICLQICWMNKMKMMNRSNEEIKNKKIRKCWDGLVVALQIYMILFITHIFTYNT
jgi:hypothetical protein